MKRPLLCVALVYASGLVIGEFFQPSLAFLCAVSLSLALAAIFWGQVRSWLLWPLLLFAGWASLVCRTAIISPSDLRLGMGNSPEIVTLRGILSETPSQRLFVQEQKEFFRWLARVETSQILRKGTNWQPTVGAVLVLTPGILPTNYFSGQCVEVTGVIALPPGPRAEGLFDYNAYLRRQGIYYQLKTESTNDWRLLAPEACPPLCDRFLAWAQTTLSRGLPEEDEPLRLLWAMTLGWRAGLTNEIYEPFMQSGTMHIFAISGLHIALISGILVSLLRVVRISRSWCGGVVVPLIWFYTAATGWQPSAIRSTIMMTIIIVGWALRRPTDMLNSLAAAAFIILLWDPQQLFGVSFQLSFAVVLSIALFLPPLQRLFDRLIQTDPLLPAMLVPRWRQWLKIPLRHVSTSFAISLAAWLGSLPLCSLYFHLFSPVTLLANLFIVPLSGLALASNVGSLICGDWLSWATELFNHSAWFWMRCMTGFSQWCVSVPAVAYSYVCGFSVAGIVIYYSLLWIAFSRWFWAPNRWRWATLSLVLGVVFLCGEWYFNHSSVNLTILPYNGSLTVFVHSPRRGSTFLSDCGTSNSVQLITKPFLRAQGVNRLPALVLTHGDLHHVGGAQLVCELFPVSRVCGSPVRFRSGVYRKALVDFANKPGLWCKLSSNDHLGPWTVLHPRADDHFPRADDNALVLRGSLNGTRVLLCSDLGRAGQEALLQRASDLHAEILITGLPSGGEPLCDRLIEAVQPRVIIIADAEFPVSERASMALRERLSKRKVPVVYTRSVGAVTIDFQSGGWKLRSINGDEVRG